MTLICRPPGKGNWHVVTIELTGPRIQLDVVAMFRVGQIIPFGQLTLRVVEVRA